MLKKHSKRVVSVLLALIMLLSTTSFTALAAPNSDIPEAMLDNVFLDALAYTGYNVQAQKNDGSIFVKYGSSVSASIRSNITYNQGPSGLETVSNAGTVTGQAPNIATFEANGLCCASYVSYVYYNYMPNVAGIDTSTVPRPSNPRLAAAYYTAGQEWVAAGKARNISFTQNSDGSGFTPAEEIPVGSLICYRSLTEDRIAHVSIYAGYYNGIHFVTHVGNDRGPEFSTINNAYKGSSPQAVALVVVPEFVEENGTIEVYKKDTDGNNLAGAVFVATNDKTGEQYKIGPTNASGYASTEGVAYGTYTIKETVFPTNYRSYDKTSWTVTVNSENNGVASFQAMNEIIPGNCKIVKESEDGIVEGLTFKLEGNGVNKTVTTEADGTVQIDNLKPGKYTVTETTPYRYVEQESQTVTVESGKTAVVNFSNILKKWRADVFKLDDDLQEEEKGGLVPVAEYSLLSDAVVEELGSPYGETQGDATLEGAVYGVYKNGELVDTYTTDENGYFITDYYACGDNNEWTIQEITPSEGYLLDETVYYVGAYPEYYEVELNTEYIDVYEDIIKGKISLIKHSDDGSTQIETPETGATFEVYLKSAGSYENAKETERAILVCDENGFARTGWLPYGVYVVEQTAGWEGKELMPAFEVNVCAHREIYSYLINNATFEAEIEIVKKDIETGKVIPASGVGFKVRNTDTGEYVVQRVNYPTPVDIEIFYTDSTGKLMLPQTLLYGNYEIIEQCTAYGYVLDGTPVAFKVDGSTNLVTVEKYNVAQKGTITVEKQGEVFSSAVETDGIWKPVYELKGLEGAVYEVTAAEDITTLDGTVRYTKGEVVATVTTEKEGTATTNPLYLGKYEIREVTAPYGMVINNEVVSVELVYAGQEIAITSISTSFVNERQKAELHLVKKLEQDETFGIGMNQEMLSVQFGLFAAEDLLAADGTAIPKDGLMETAFCDKDGRITFVSDLPIGADVYVKELATDQHYKLSDSAYVVTFNYAGQDERKVTIALNDGETISNEIIRGSIVGKKLDEDGFSICGALFGLFAEDETEFTEDNAILTCTSNEIGVFGFENVPYGRWIVREIKPAAAFMLNENSYAVTVAEDEAIIEIVIENEFITGSVQTTKVDAEYLDHKLTGAVFEVYVDVDNNQEFNAEIDLFVGEMKEVETGVYQMNNLRYNGYFLHEKTAPDGFLKDDGYYYFAIKTDGETVVVENEAGVGFTNQPIPKPPVTDSPQTGDDTNLGFWIGLGAVAIGGLVAVVVIGIKNKKEEDEE